MTAQAGKSRAGTIAAAVGMLVLYALSPPLVDKVAGLYPRKKTGAMLRPVYAPVRWLVENVTAIDHFHFWYRELWEG